VTIQVAQLDAFDNDFEKTATAFIDFRLLDSTGFPLIVPEARSEDIAKEVSGCFDTTTPSLPRMVRFDESRKPRN